MRHPRSRILGFCLVAGVAAAGYTDSALDDVGASPSPAAAEEPKTGPPEEKSMQIQYLEIVTPDVDATCAAYAQLHGVSFSVPEAGLGNARTAALANGGMIGVRAPMRETEEPVVRPYLLVDDIEAAIEAAEAAGGQIAHPPMEIPGHGTFAIYIQGGIQHGLWQL